MFSAINPINNRPHLKNNDDRGHDSCREQRRRPCRVARASWTRRALRPSLALPTLRGTRRWCGAPGAGSWWTGGTAAGAYAAVGPPRRACATGTADRLDDRSLAPASRRRHPLTPTRLRSRRLRDGGNGSPATWAAEARRHTARRRRPRALRVSCARADIHNFAKIPTKSHRCRRPSDLPYCSDVDKVLPAAAEEDLATEGHVRPAQVTLDDTSFERPQPPPLGPQPRALDQCLRPPALARI